MRFWRHRTILLMAVCAGLLLAPKGSWAYADSAEKNLGLFILGKPGTHGFAGLFASAHESLSGVLAQNGFALETSQIVFSENPENSKGHYSCTRASLEKNIQALAKQGAYDHVFLFIAGHANGRDEDAVFHLPGQDISYRELMGLIQQVQAKHWVVVIAAAQGQVWVKEFSGPNRIVIAGNEQREFDFIPVQFLTFFPAMFEKAAQWHAQNPETESAVKPVSLAEVFFLTARAVHRWYVSNNLLATEEPVLEANGDGKAVPAWFEKTEEVSNGQEVLQASPVWIQEAGPANKILFSMSGSGGSQR